MWQLLGVIGIIFGLFIIYCIVEIIFVCGVNKIPFQTWAFILIVLARSLDSFFT